jgi:hypothetical protein
MWRQCLGRRLPPLPRFPSGLAPYRGAPRHDGAPVHGARGRQPASTHGPSSACPRTSRAYRARRTRSAVADDHQLDGVRGILRPLGD